MSGVKRLSPKDMILSRVEKSPTGCWEWIGAYDARGERPKLGHSFAYRRAYEAFVGPIPVGLTIDHLRFNPRCCNPEHLRAVPHIANARRQRSAITDICERGHSAFYIAFSGRRRCRECERLKNSERRQRNRERYNAYARAWKAKKRSAQKAV